MEFGQRNIRVSYPINEQGLQGPDVGRQRAYEQNVGRSAAGLRTLGPGGRSQSGRRVSVSTSADSR